MRIPRFYCPDLNVQSKTFDLPDAAHRHAIQVLRLKPGALLRLFDGYGHEYDASLESMTKQRSTVTLQQRYISQNESPVTITLLQGVSRGERMDYALQKAVELGVNHIVPMITQRCNVQLSTERANKRLQHWRGVIISACEQSGRNKLPLLNDVTQFEQVIQQYSEQCRLVLDPTAALGFSDIKPQRNVVIMIGPEGGLSDQELQSATATGFQPVKFGPRILRTETASVAAIAVIQAMWGDLG